MRLKLHCVSLIKEKSGIIETVSDNSLQLYKKRLEISSYILTVHNAPESKLFEKKNWSHQNYKNTLRTQRTDKAIP